LVSEVRADPIITGPAANYLLLFEGTNSNAVQLSSATIAGNVGVGGSGQLSVGGPSTINGEISFSAANTGQFTNGNTGNVFTGPDYNNASVAAALTAVNNLNATLGVETGTAISINGNTTINASNGILDSSGNEVFTVKSFSLANGQTLTISGNGHGVVFNFASAAQFLGNTALTGGLFANEVLFNFVGGGGLNAGPALTINNNASANASNLVQGVFLDPNGTITLTNARLSGSVFGGSTNSGAGFGDGGSGSGAPQTFSQSTLIATTPEPSSILLFGLGVSSLLGFGVARRKRQAAISS
jgi:hypothetical protein